MCWVYQRHREKDGNYLYTVGYYVVIVDPESTIRSNWVPIQDCFTELDARKLVNYLNGGSVLVSNP